MNITADVEKARNTVIIHNIRKATEPVSDTAVDVKERPIPCTIPEPTSINPSRKYGMNMQYILVTAVSYAICIRLPGAPDVTP